jgi:hypothetical protein
MQETITISSTVLFGSLFALFVALLAFTVKYVINSFKAELQQDRITRAESMKSFGEKVEKVEKFLEKISEEIFDRLRKAETDINNLWTEHNLFKESGNCSLLHQHSRITDKTKEQKELPK